MEFVKYVQIIQTAVSSESQYECYLLRPDDWCYNLQVSMYIFANEVPISKTSHRGYKQWSWKSINLYLVYFHNITSNISYFVISFLASNCFVRPSLHCKLPHYPFFINIHGVNFPLQLQNTFISNKNQCSLIYKPEQLKPISFTPSKPRKIRKYHKMALNANQSSLDVSTSQNTHIFPLNDQSPALVYQTKVRQEPERYSATSRQ